MLSATRSERNTPFSSPDRDPPGANRGDATESDERMAALEDRVLYLEAALHHILDAVGVPHNLPDPLTHLQRLEVPHERRD